MMFSIKPLTSLDINSSFFNAQVKHWSLLCFIKDICEEDYFNKLRMYNITSMISYELLNVISLLEIENLFIRVNKNVNLEKSIISDVKSEYLSYLKVLSADWKNHVTKVPNNDSKNSSDKSPADDEEKPGSSQKTTQELTGYGIQIVLDAFRSELGLDEGFAVHPRHDCPHLPAVAPVPTSGIDVTSPCIECSPDPCSALENWICLTCYTVHCGRVIKEHMMLHSTELSHPIVLGFLDLSVWCYSCDSYIESPVLYESKNATYLSKFGETMPNIYTNDNQRQLMLE